MEKIIGFIPINLDDEFKSETFLISDEFLIGPGKTPDNKMLLDLSDVLEKPIELICTVNTTKSALLENVNKF